jgi:hypothetical protein
MPARRAFSAPVWRNRGFVLLWSGQAFSQFGALLPRHSRLRDAAPGDLLRRGVGVLIMLECRCLAVLLVVAGDAVPATLYAEAGVR